MNSLLRQGLLAASLALCALLVGPATELVAGALSEHRSPAALAAALELAPEVQLASRAAPDSAQAAEPAAAASARTQAPADDLELVATSAAR